MSDESTRWRVMNRRRATPPDQKRPVVKPGAAERERRADPDPDRDAGDEDGDAS
ncbi:hypothetical protein [Phytohabitans suffuscus]|uniref:Uncharacterized protein n=1 Tax=Phytohabitans suffuscus TaxID=624315 RepID=A0A6F8Z0C4_9ACTN|nr:hypothetical protein [Phytohabitans suffuscus]BCB91880.1 hypothetical protein Psuf_091930 [Phytohabitans suffuscus]